MHISMFLTAINKQEPHMFVVSNHRSQRGVARPVSHAHHSTPSVSTLFIFTSFDNENVISLL